MIYVGRDKFENEDLIKYGLPHDVWYGPELHSNLTGIVLPVEDQHVCSLETGFTWTTCPQLMCTYASLLVAALKAYLQISWRTVLSWSRPIPFKATS